ncbi:MAG: ATP synthase F1 subunit epsilon [Verrucomicrobia bacterium]|nr:MAG: ATP synthase F1 subunit epsilon [Verrucomicrobiota bacterium]
MALTVEIVTPAGIAWKSDNVDALTLPAASGEIQILPGHVPILTILNAGSLVAQIGESANSLAIDEGYARCMGDVVSVLTEAAINVEEIDEEQAEKTRIEALKELDKIRRQPHADDAEIERLESIARFSIAQKLTKAKKRQH